MKKTCMLLALVCLVAIAPANAFQSGPGSLERAVDSILAGHTGRDRPGATIGIVREGKLIFQKGYGMADLKLKKANNARVVYNIASGSKQFTAMVVADLIRQKKLALTDPVGKFLPGFPDYGKVITLENLLYHTSGVRDYMVLMWLTGKRFDKPFSNQQALDMIVRQRKLNFNPGDRCVYSNSNYVLLAEIIHRVTGKTLATYSRDLFETLGMTSTSFGDAGGGRTRAISYFKSGGVYLPFKNSRTAYGDGGLLTTLEDLVRWDREFYDTTSLVTEILKRGTLNNGNLLNYGRGILFSHYRNEPVQTHAGAFLGFRTETLRFPGRQVSIICLANSEEINPESITRAIAGVYLFGDSGPSAPVQAAGKTEYTANKPVTAENAAAITGIYQVTPDVLIHIRYEDGLLSGQVTGQPRQMLYPDSSSTFKVGATNDRVVFGDLLREKYQQLTVVQNQHRTSAQRISVLPSETYSRYTGNYYSPEQQATYRFYVKNGKLWFKTGRNAAVPAEVLVPHKRLYFDYKNLEQATIDFSVDDNGNVNGFVLNSGRVSDIHFVRR